MSLDSHSPVATHPTAPRSTRRTSSRRYLRALRRPRGAVGITLLSLLVGAAVLVPLFSSGYDAQSMDTFAGPSWAHPFGTDELGRDIAVRTLYGLRIDLVLLFTGVLTAMVAGTVLGAAGALSRALGTFVQRVFDIIQGFPSLILGMVVALVVGPGMLALTISIVIFALPGFGRLARAGLLAQERREYVLAAQTMGISRWRVLARHILPNTIDPIIVHTAIAMVVAIFLETGLSVVGLGIQPPEPSLGSLLNSGVRFLSLAPVYVLGPAIVLLLLTLSFSLLSDALNAEVLRK
jgi:peptide/nickel transport system permease protein